MRCWAKGSGSWRNNQNSALTGGAESMYNKGRKVRVLHGGLWPPRRKRRRVGANYTAAFLFLILRDQRNHKGQNRKKDHDHLIIRHTLTPFFCKSGAKKLSMQKPSCLWEAYHRNADDVSKAPPCRLNCMAVLLAFYTLSPLINTACTSVLTSNGEPLAITISASLPASSEPTRSATPMCSAGWMVMARSAS